MTKKLCLSAVLPLLFLALPAAAEVDLSGSWKLTMLSNTPLGTKAATLTFERRGHELTAVIRGDGVDARCIGYIDNGELHFFYIVPGKKEDLVAKYSGHVRGDLMGGEVDMGKKGVTTWAAVRGEDPGVDLSGRWTLITKGASPSGLRMVKVTFRQEEHRLIVILHGETSEIECDGYVDGREIVFYYVRPTDDGRFVAKFTGQISGALMGGEVDMGELGKTTWRATQDV